MSTVIPTRVARRASDSFLALADGCHESTYSVASHGYAQIGWTEDGGDYVTTAHRAAWVAAHGSIPNGMTVDHTCKNRRCVRADHLRLLTNYENARRTFGRDWPVGQCAKGHPNAELYQQASGRIRCRTCTREKARAANARRRSR